MNEIYARRRDLVVGALREIGVEVQAPKGTIYVWAPVPEGHTSTSFCRAGARGGGGDRLAGLDVRAERRGLLPDLADHARRPHRRGGRADARAPGLGRFALRALAPVAVEAAPLVLGRDALEQLAPPSREAALAATRSRWRVS